MKSFGLKKIKPILPSNFIVQKLPPSQPNCVLLTFDDGPDPRITPKVLELLEAHRARAVFFAVGRRIEKAPQVLKMVRDQGHLIGNHTYIHSNTKQPWFFEYWQDLIRCQELIGNHIGRKPKVFRPPGGRISLTSLVLSRLLGMKIVLWSLEAGDWRCRTPDQAKRIGEFLIEKTSPRDIVLLHDDNQNVLSILEMILPFMEAHKLDLHNGIEFLNR